MYKCWNQHLCCALHMYCCTYVTVNLLAKIVHILRYRVQYVRSTQCVKLTVTTLQKATQNYPLASYFVLPGAILDNSLHSQPAWEGGMHTSITTSWP